MVKSTRPYYPIIALASVLLIGAFLRFYRLSELTEFLGDQGRTEMEIYNAWRQKSLPLIGPTVLSGQHLGPAFYYVIGPAFILSNFNPIIPAATTALLGFFAIAILWWLGRELFGWHVATMVALLWAVSPQIVSSDRVLWEPNIIPFFIFLYLAALYKGWGVISGIALGILVQLHYPNFLFIGLTILFYAKHKRPRVLIGTVLGFFVVLLPFLAHEFTHGFENIIGILRNFFSGGEPLAKRQILINLLDYSSRMIRRVVPLRAGLEGIALILFVIISLVERSFWKTFFAIWFLVGTGAIALYHGVVFDHYLFFVLPVPFFMFGYILLFLKERTNLWIPILLVSMIAYLQLVHTDINQAGFSDLTRVDSVTKAIIAEASGNPFAFGLIGSRSFNDLHYRYFFLRRSIIPQSLLDGQYQTLFLVCESPTCPTSDDLAGQDKVQILCYDAHCEGEYPTISLNSWKLDSVKEVTNARLYQYQRQL